MILTVDIGNTHTVMGLFDGEKLCVSIRIASDAKRTEDELEYYIEELFAKKGFDVTSAEGGIVSSVVPNCTKPMAKAMEHLIGKKTLVVGPGMKTGLSILYDDPKEVGADRIVNAVGALTRHKAPLIIIDLGTATTYCVVNEKMQYLGGIISPGIGISSEALFQRTAKLPRVELTIPPKFLNTNTVDAIRAGLMFSLIGEMEYIVGHLKEELSMEDAPVIATGGLANVLKDHTKAIEYYEPDLTLWGLKTIYEKNTPLR
ncbi:MAG: type III pantothenate kinase [Tissierellia bacterium]|nr:type III pantothenate kinase [Tissierellia bacterium]